MPAINHFLSRACEPDDERKGEERESFLSRFFSAEKDERFMAVDVFKRDSSRDEMVASSTRDMSTKSFPDLR